jgi:hypothetical protein
MHFTGCSESALSACFDVGKDVLEGYALHLHQGAPDRQITLSIERKTDQLEEKLGELADYADEKYVGLNLRRRQSGDYEGEVKIHKACPDYRRGRDVPWPGRS